VAYVAARLPAFEAGYASRPFTLGERLLTEGRVLFLYLAGAFFPLPGSGVRVLYDDLALSTALLAPWTTAAALGAWAALVAAAVRYAGRAPWFSFAVGWYLVGHALESTVIPLEIAFSHRNYLPLLGVSLAATAGFVELTSSARLQRVRRLVVGAGVSYLLLLWICMRLSADLWGHPVSQARAWVRQQPESPRAVMLYGAELLAAQDLDSAYRLYASARARWPGDAVIALSLFELGCFHPGIDPSLPELRRTLAGYAGPDAARAAGLVGGLVARLDDGSCPHQTAADILALVETMLESPGFAFRRGTLLYSSAMLLDRLGEKTRALARLEEAIALEPQVPLLQQAVLWSVQLGDIQRARALIDVAETSARIPARTRWRFRLEIAGMRQLVELYESLPGQPSE
jgi:protein O-mannosyl-transferase